MQAMIHSKSFRSYLLLAILVVSLFAFDGCQAATGMPSTDSSKRALRLRGFDYGEKSLLRAASTSVEVAVRTFIDAGMNPNVTEPTTGGSALISAATRGELEMVNALLQGG